MKTKTRRLSKILIVMATLLALVFVSSVGFTLAVTFKKLYTNNEYSTKAYTINNSHKIVNDTITSPILFGADGKNEQVVFSYSYGYDFDVCFTYSLAWSGGGSTDNVILNFSNRDAFMVDATYIYYKDTISAGTGNLVVISGVDFADPYDTAYIGKSLTITVSAQVERKTNSTTYTTSHSLYHNNSYAATAWLTNKGYNKTAEAYVIVYNYLSKTANGVSHPGMSSGASLKIVGSDDLWIGGEKKYAGMYAYIVAGTTDITLTVSVVGSWVEQDGSPADGAFTNNITIDMMDGWNFVGFRSEDAVTPIYNYSKKIPANTTAYIPITKSIEINCQGRDQSISYSDFIAWSQLTINNVSVQNLPQTGENPAPYFVNGYCGFKISSSNKDIEEAYSQPQLTINNPSYYNAALYKLTKDTSISGARSVIRYTNVTLTNNTGTDKLINLGYSLRYYLSNGGSAPNAITEEKLLLKRPTNFSEVYSECYYRVNGSGNYYPCTDVWDNNNTYYSIGGAEFVQLSTKPIDWDARSTTHYYTFTGTNYELNTQSDWATASAGGIYAYNIRKADDTNVWNRRVLTALSSYITSVLNHGQSISTIVVPAYSSITLASSYEVAANLLQHYENYSKVAAGEVTEASEAWVELIPSISGPIDTKATNIEIEGSVTSNRVSVKVKNNTQAPVSLGSITTSNITVRAYNVTNGTFSTINSTISANIPAVLMPNESVEVATCPYSGSDILDFSNCTCSGSVATVSEPRLVNAGTENAYIINTTNKSYYVRFNGTISGTQSNFATVSSYNYYLGIIRPGQIVSVPMTTAGTLEAIEDTGTYVKDSTLSSWSGASNIFNKYFIS